MFKFTKLQFNLDNEVNQFQQGYFRESISTSTNYVGISISTQQENQLRQAEMSIEFQQHKFNFNKQNSRWKISFFICQYDSFSSVSISVPLFPGIWDITHGKVLPFLVGAFLDKSARLLQWLVFFSFFFSDKLPHTVCTTFCAMYTFNKSTQYLIVNASNMRYKTNAKQKGPLFQLFGSLRLSTPIL